MNEEMNDTESDAGFELGAEDTESRIEIDTEEPVGEEGALGFDKEEDDGNGKSEDENNGIENPEVGRPNEQESEKENDWSDLISGKDSGNEIATPAPSAPTGEPISEKVTENADPRYLEIVEDVLKDLPEDFKGTNLKEFFEDYPEEATAAAYIAQKIFEKMNGSKAKTEEPETQNNPETERVMRLEAYAAQKAQEDYDREVLGAHPDAVKIVRNDPKFKEWLLGQGNGIKDAFANSSDPKDLCSILNMYKGSQKPVDSRKKSLYSGSGNGTRRHGGGYKDDFEAGFEAGAKD